MQVGQHFDGPSSVPNLYRGKTNPAHSHRQQCANVRIIIGDHVSLAPEVFITASDYRFVSGRPFREQPKRELDVVIGHDVWLGARVVVTAGVTIGDGCIVGAGAVVTRNLPPGSIAVGVPARVVSQRPSETIS